MKEGAVEPLVSEYTFLKAVEPVAAPGSAAAVGLWVKGDSGWGKIVFEIEDARGTVWRTEGTWHDWPGDLAIHFDGWRFLRYPIDGQEGRFIEVATTRPETLLGDTAIATNPFEYYVDYGMQIKTRSRAVQTFLVQHVGSGTYLPTERAVRGGGYRCWVSATVFRCCAKPGCCRAH